MIKWYSGEWSGAPVMSGTAGAMKDTLKACLCDGFGSKTPSAVVVAGGIATATVSGGHTFVKDAVALLAGITVTGGSINGDRRVLSTTTNTISVDATGIADQTASLSTPSIKVSPLGWTEQFAGTANKFAAKSSQLDSTGMVFRLNDTGTNNCRVIGYESMSDIDTGVRAFPTTGQFSGGYYWSKSNSSNTNARGWYLVGDEYGFYLVVQTSPAPGGYAYGVVTFFGDIVPIQSGDPYACVLTGDRNAGSGTFDGNLAAARNGYGGGGCVVARSFAGVGGPSYVGNACKAMLLSDANQRFSGADHNWLPYPANPGNLLMIAPLLANEQNNFGNIRGEYPGLYHLLQYCGGTAFTPGSIIPGSGAYAGRNFLVTPSGSHSASNTGFDGFVLFDLTGPWR